MKICQFEHENSSSDFVSAIGNSTFKVAKNLLNAAVSQVKVSSNRNAFSLRCVTDCIDGKTNLGIFVKYRIFQNTLVYCKKNYRIKRNEKKQFPQLFQIPDSFLSNNYGLRLFRRFVLFGFNGIFEYWIYDISQSGFCPEMSVYWYTQYMF